LNARILASTSSTIRNIFTGISGTLNTPHSGQHVVDELQPSRAFLQGYQVSRTAHIYTSTSTTT
jgi:hypothetical protein